MTHKRSSYIWQEVVYFIVLTIVIMMIVTRYFNL